ncbi:hypothetical protein CsatB_008015 [Cannabis sativa]
MSWDRLAALKEERGMIFRHLHDFNLAMLAKQGCWSCAKERSRLFTVYSAYLLLQQQKPKNPGPNNPGFWQKLWHLKIPPKVINFLWRAISECLPTCLNLVTKHVQRRLVLSLSSAAITDIGLICHAAMLCWVVCKACNQAVWDKRTSIVNDVTTSASVNFDHWKKAQKNSTLLSLLIENNSDGSEFWIKPSLNQININIDGALFHQECSYGFGLVARDSSGRLI